MTKKQIEKKLLMEKLMKQGVSFNRNGIPVKMEDVQVSKDEASRYLEVPNA